MPPSAAIDWLDGEMAKLHGAAACDSAKVCPAIVAVPARAGPLFAAAATVTLPLPVPDAPEAIESHGSFAIAVHEQKLAVVTVTSVVLAPDEVACDAGEIEKLHGAGSCAIVNVWPAMVTVPLRAAPVLASAFMVTVPLPAPVEPDATEIQGALLTAVQLQRAAAVTVAVAAPALDDIDWLVGDTVNVHGASACVTVTVCPAIVSEPVRAMSVLAATATDTLPFPAPVEPPVIVSQLSTAVALHEHDVSAATAKLVDPASAVTDWFDGDTVTLHGGGASATPFTDT